MKTLIQKELREHFVLALVALPVLTLLWVAVYRTSVTQAADLWTLHSHSGDGLQPLLASELLTSTLVFCAVFGALLGWMQIRSESHRDLWGFLMHRPISRTRIFTGKVVAGVLLYILGAALPLTVFVWIVQSPGNVAAPFEWSMVLPLAANFLAGMVCYLAGLLTGLRQARWYASRGLGLGAAAVVLFGVVIVPEFWQALLIVAIGLAALGVAVWGAFQGNGSDSEQPIAGRVALIAVFTVGSLVVVSVVIAGLTSLLNRPGVRFASFMESYTMAGDGNVYIRSREPTGQTELLDLERQPVMDPDTGQAGEPPAAEWALTVSTEVRSQHPYRAMRRFFEPWRISEHTLWYWMADGRLAGYDLPTRRLAANIKPDDPGEGFLRPLEAGHIVRWTQPQAVATPRAVYRIDPDARKLGRIFEVAADDRILAISEHPLRHVIVATAYRVHWVTAQGDSVWQVPYEFDDAYNNLIAVFALNEPGDFGLLFYPLYRALPAGSAQPPIRALWVSRTEGIQRSLELPPLGAVNRLSSHRPGLHERVTTAIMPPVVTAIIDWRFIPERGAMLLPFSLAGAGFCILIGWWIGHRQRLSVGPQAGWAIFHLVFGLPGLLAGLSVREWPARELCAECQQPRAVDRERCAHCGAGFAPPQANGTEIFEPLRAE
jgi:ABC-type transport system involved in multi-copper enzyme maturation permease subunit